MVSRPSVLPTTVASATAAAVRQGAPDANTTLGPGIAMRMKAASPKARNWSTVIMADILAESTGFRQRRGGG